MLSIRQILLEQLLEVATARTHEKKILAAYSVPKKEVVKKKKPSRAQVPAPKKSAHPKKSRS